MTGASDWSDADKARLRALWAEDLSAAEIGRRMGRSKNAIVGKAHRMGLEARPSPIVTSGTRRHPKPARAPAVTLAPLKVLAVAAPPPARPPIAAPVVVPVSVSRPAAAPRPASPLPYARSTACCWPIGEPGTRGFRFCDAPSAAGKPYCQPHCDKAFVRLRDRREDAEAVA